MNVIVRENYNLGENLFFVVYHETDVTLTVQSLSPIKYFYISNNAWQSSNTYNTTTLSITDSVQDGTSYFRLVEIPKTLLPKNTIYKITVSNNTDSVTKYTFYGQRFLSPPLVNIYGNLYDALGRPISGHSIVFSVLNPVGYFDNNPVTAITASVSTDENGYFSINLNRRYDYVVTVPELNYRKIIKLSQLPNNVNSFELVFEEVGSIC